MKIKILISVLLMLTAVPAFAGDKESTYDRVMRTGTIRCGYMSYPPDMTVDPGTKKLSGFAYDIMMKAGEDLGLKIEWAEEVGTGNFVESLKTGRIDMYCLAGYESAARAKYVASTVPVLFVPVLALARADDARFNAGLARINGEDVKISLIDGSSHVPIARQDFPKARVLSLPELTDFTQPLLDVETGKADIAFADPPIIKEYMAKNPGKLKLVSEDPVRIYSKTFLYRRGDEAFGQMIDVALRNQLNFGFLEKAVKAHEKYPGSYYWPAKPYEVTR